jgi:hypothetical protein
VTNGGYDASALQVIINGNDVIVYRHQEKGRCTYRGKLQPDRRNIIGTVSCNWVDNAFWRATIVN